MSDPREAQPPPAPGPEEVERGLEAAALGALGLEPLGEPQGVDEREMREALVLFARAVGSQAPPPLAGLRDRLLERVARAPGRRPAEPRVPTGAPPPGPAEPHGVQVWKAWAEVPPDPSGVVVRRAGDGAWEATSVPGVAVRPLHVDSARRYVTMLVRMAPGSAYPRHVHAGAEECYVLEGDLLEGDLLVGGEALGPGDYQRASGGSEHAVQSTRGGCLLLIVSSQDDELSAGIGS